MMMSGLGMQADPANIAPMRATAMLGLCDAEIHKMKKGVPARATPAQRTI